ncbi:MAG TPA: hypothetical protein VD997_02015 [Phycisphaerales bacterium]|nr:hypothetical protein [Phycisphaerales bacterium]
MSVDNRLSKVERHLSPRQLVIMDVVESRSKYRSFLESGQAMAQTGIPRTTLMDRIAESVKATNPGADRLLRTHLIREAQREGKFLGQLGNEVSVQIAEEERELALMTALLSAHLALILNREEQTPEDQLELWLTSAVEHRRRLLCLQAAVRRISEAYFDGNRLLYAKSEECLAENLAGIEKVLAMAVGPRCQEGSRPAEDGMDFREMGPTPEETENDAEELASAWVINVQASVAASFGEDDHAVRLLRSLLLKE